MRTVLDNLQAMRASWDRERGAVATEVRALEGAIKRRREENARDEPVVAEKKARLDQLATDVASLNGAIAAMQRQ